MRSLSAGCCDIAKVTAETAPLAPHRAAAVAVPSLVEVAFPSVIGALPAGVPIRLAVTRVAPGVSPPILLVTRSLLI